MLDFTQTGKSSDSNSRLMIEDEYLHQLSLKITENKWYQNVDSKQMTFYAQYNDMIMNYEKMSSLYCQNHMP